MGFLREVIVTGLKDATNTLTEARESALLALSGKMIIKTGHHNRLMIRWSDTEQLALKSAAADRNITITDFIRISSLANTGQYQDLILPEADEIAGVEDIVAGIMAGLSLSQVAKKAGVARHVLEFRLKKAGLTPMGVRAMRKAKP